MRKKVMEEITDFWINFVYGDPPSSLVDANNNEVNLRHLKRILGITDLEKRIDVTQKYIEKGRKSHE